MVGATVRGARNLPAFFNIPPDEYLPTKRCPPTSTQPSSDHKPGVLEDLPLDYQAQSSNYLNKSQDASCQGETNALTQVRSRGARRRPPISTGTFEPLEDAQENLLTCPQEKSVPYPAAGHSFSRASNPGSPSGHNLDNNPLINARVEYSVKQVIKKQLAVTPLTTKDAALMSTLEMPQDRELRVNMALEQHMGVGKAPLKAPEMVEVIEQAVSPSLTQVSERGDSFMDRSSRDGSFSAPRIEDSLAELDRLEDEIEAISAVADSRRVERTKPERDIGAPTGSSKPTTTKRVGIAPGQSATVRLKPTGQKARPALRRSNSLTLREKKTEKDEQFISEQKAANVSLARSKSTSIRAADSRTPVKSTKPLTIPKFQLPGEAVSQRLKEQREARKAQQAEAQKAHAAPPKPKSSKPLARPTFELPGEVISRRKREEREARLKAQEEEERKRREFKARPIRHSMTPGTLPRETIASRARQGKIGLEETPRNQDANRARRLATSAVSNSTQGRGRHSVVFASDDGSRATSVSTTVSEMRSSVSLEEAAQQRARGKAIFARDNSYSQDREKERRGREAAARVAREQAAERSRAASREWAERQRQKQQEHAESMRLKRHSRVL